MIYLFAVAALVCLLWSTWYVLRGSLLAGCFGYLLTAACFNHFLLAWEVAGLAVTLERVVLVLVVAAYVLQRKLLAADPKPLQWSERILLLLLGVLTLSTLLGDAPKSGPSSAWWHLLTGYWFPAAIYWVGRQQRIAERGCRRLYIGLAMLGVYLAFTGVMEVTRQWSLVVPSYIAQPELGLHFGRARGPMLQSVSYGLLLGICTFAALALWSRRSAWSRAAITTLVPLYGAGLYCSFTRSVWLGTGVGLMAFLAFRLSRQWRNVVLSAVCAAGVLLMATNFDAVMEVDRGSGATEASDSADMRRAFTYVSWQMFADRPLVGFGFGTFYDAKLPYLSDRTTPLHLESTRLFIHHNTYLSLLVDTGLVGLGLYLALIAAWARMALQLIRSPTAADWMRLHGVLTLAALGTYLVQCLFHEVSYTTIDNSLMFLLAGITSGLAARLPATGGATAEQPVAVPATIYGPAPTTT